MLFVRPTRGHGGHCRVNIIHQNNPLRNSIRTTLGLMYLIATYDILATTLVVTYVISLNCCVIDTRTVTLLWM